MKGLILFLFLSLSFVLNANNNPPIYKHLNANDGLSQSWVKSIIQDQQGFMWFGTSDGLNKYDGYKFTVFKHNPKSTNSIKGNSIEALIEDHNECIWIGTNKGLSKYNPYSDSFTSEIQWPQNTINTLFIYNKLLFIGTMNGLFILDIENNKLRPDLSSIINIAINHNRINAFAIDDNENVWMASENGFIVLNLTTISIKKYPIVYSTERNILIYSLVIDNENNVWGGSQKDGLFLLKHTKTNYKIYNYTHNNLDSSLSEGAVISMHILSNKQLWIGIENGGVDIINLSNFDADNLTFSHLKDNNFNQIELNNNSVHSIYEDNLHDIWIGTYAGGVNYLSNRIKKFNHFVPDLYSKNNLANSIVNVIYKNNNELWIGTEGGLTINEINSNGISYDHQLKISNHSIWSILYENKQTIWIGKWAGGIDIFNKENGKTTNLILKDKEGNTINAPNVFYITKDLSNHYWIATMGNGLLKLDINKNLIQQYTHLSSDPKSISSNYIRHIFENSKNELWLSTATSIEILDRKNDTFYHFYNRLNDPTSISSDGANMIFEDSNKRMWFATNAGLNYYSEKENTFHYYQEEDGLQSNSIKSIAEDDHGNFWIGTNKGITRFKNAIDIPSKPIFKNYDLKEGLRNNEFSRRAVFKDNNGIMYFGGLRGLTYFHPDSITENHDKPNVVFTNFEIFNKPVPINHEKSPLKKHINFTDTIELKHSQSVINIEFSALNYIAPYRNEYAYKLNGFETEWNYTSDRRMVTYTNLDAGSYTFMVKASNNDGYWTDYPRELVIKILPPWHQTQLAYISYLTLFILLLTLFIIYTQKRLNDKHLLKLERHKHEQEEILAKQKLQFFTNISHEFRTPLTLISSPLEDILKNRTHQLPDALKEKFKIIYMNARKLNRLIDELMEFRKLQFNQLSLKPAKIEINEFVKNISNFFKEEALSNNIVYNFIPYTQPLFIYFDPKMIEKVIFNLLSNAFKVTPEDKKIEIKITKDLDNIHLSISDEGPGLTSDQISKIFDRFYQIEGSNKAYYSGTGIGLSLAKSLIELHKGNITINSSNGKGSEFLVNLRTGKDHFKNIQISENQYQITDHSENFSTLSYTSSKHKSNNPSKKTLLIIEDNAQLRKYLKDELANKYNIIEAKNGKEGLLIVQNKIPALVISDVLMPEMDGIEFCKSLKNNIKTSHIPVILLTAKGTVNDQITGNTAGADSYIVKPFHPEVLISKINQLLNERELLFDKYSSQLNFIENIKDFHPTDKDFIKLVNEYVIENINDQSLNVEKLGEQMSLSRSQLYRKIKTLTGYSAIEFIRIIRLQKAQQILKNGNISINEVVFIVGFSSPSYFTKCYKTQFGKLPSDEF